MLAHKLSYQTWYEPYTDHHLGMNFVPQCWLNTTYTPTPFQGVSFIVRIFFSSNY